VAEPERPVVLALPALPALPVLRHERHPRLEHRERLRRPHVQELDPQERSPRL
jgi:hypothetical protein